MPPERPMYKVRQSDRERLRRQYRAFLKAAEKQGLRRHAGQTSADILASVPAGIDRIAAAELRTLYLAARYDEARDVTPEQVRAAKLARRKSSSK